MTTENGKLRALLAEARGLIDRNRLVLGEYETPREVAAIGKAIDAALAEIEPPQGHKTCEFCKGRGTVPTKTPWSPQDVLGGDK